MMQEMNPANDAAHPTPPSLGEIPLMASALPLYIFYPSVISRIIMGKPTTIRAPK
jgi:hypothetical protein